LDGNVQVDIPAEAGEGDSVVYYDPRGERMVQVRPDRAYKAVGDEAPYGFYGLPEAFIQRYFNTFGQGMHNMSQDEAYQYYMNNYYNSGKGLTSRPQYERQVMRFDDLSPEQQEAYRRSDKSMEPNQYAARLTFDPSFRLPENTGPGFTVFYDN
jgi:hypothetical protein